jgi:hypothetical protein
MLLLRCLSIRLTLAAVLMFSLPALHATESANHSANHPGKSVLAKQSPKKQSKKTANLFPPLSDEIKDISQRINNGVFTCEFNNIVKIEKRTDHIGYVNLTHKKITTVMLPVVTVTGALRLESKAKGLVWLQLPTKSMLMNSNIGQRLADDCQASN